LGRLKSSGGKKGVCENGEGSKIGSIILGGVGTQSKRGVKNIEKWRPTREAEEKKHNEGEGEVEIDHISSPGKGETLGAHTSRTHRDGREQSLEVTSEAI